MPDVPGAIVVGVDFSPHSRQALEAATHLARDLGAPLVFVHAVPRLMPMETGTGIMALDPTVDAEAAKTSAIELSTEWAKVARQQGIATRTVVGVEDAARLICREAETRVAALIVVGTHGRTGATRLLMGSVAERVVRHAHRPVLVVPPLAK